MSKLLAGIDRFLLFLISLLLLGGGLWGIGVALSVPFATDLSDRLDPSIFDKAYDTVWYLVALWAVVILGVLLGLWWIAVNLRRRGFNRVRSNASSEDGTIHVNLTRVAAAIDEQIKDYPRVTQVSHRVAMDRSRPTVTWTVRAEAEADVAGLRQVIEASEVDFREAMPGIDVDSTYKIHLAPVEIS